MKTLAAVAAGAAFLLAGGVASAQYGDAMGSDSGMGGGGWMGGYGGIWALVLLVAVAGVVVWILKKKGK